ncbi:MAG: DNA mismatch repair protein MutS, partial [Clostridia bacterium]|nr:DNA mismatch repair protein MutS [Clostridia bacterium]
MALSPMMSHYLQTKEKYKDCILFYRLGDFYEMFFDDAVKVSALIDLTLTGKDCGLEEKAPMCGVPFHAADMYISKLVALGEKVAICEQLTEATSGRELVKRDVVKVVTAGTVTNNELIDDKSNNFLGAVYLGAKIASFAWTDITTGEFSVKQFSGDNLYSELLDTLVRVSPVEIICNQIAEEKFKDLPLVKHGVLPKFNAFTESEFNYHVAEQTLKNQLGISSLSAYFNNEESACVSVSGALLSYLRETQKQTLSIINSVNNENQEKFM